MVMLQTKTRARELSNKPIPYKLMFTQSGKAMMTAIEYLLARPQYEKDFDDDYSDDETNVTRALAATASLLKSKNYNAQTIQKLIDDNSLNALIQNLLIKGIDESINAGDHNGSVDMMKAYFKISLDFHSMGYEEFAKIGDQLFQTYQGTAEQNQRILKSIFEGKHLDPEFERDFEERKTAGLGTARIFQRGIVKAMRGLLNYTTDKKYLDTPIIILGAGPAGILTARTLTEIGYKNIQILDESGKFNGIWKISGVNKGTINNPFNINFLGIKLPASTGRKGSGSKLLRFLDQVIFGKKDMNGRRMKNYFMQAMPKLIKAKVLSIKAGDLNHEVKYRDENGDEQSITTPILINSLGLGHPTDLMAENAPMKTSTPNKAGSRWQIKITERLAERLRDKNITLIGLGNSTIEMLMQIQECNRKGFNINYKVLSHYPQASVENPDQYIEFEGREYRVFRDLEKSNLVDLEGDIPAARKAYMKALKDGNIISDVVEWKHETESKITRIKLRSGKEEDIKTHQQLTLTGYKPSEEIFKAMNISLADDGCPLYDYDGEVHNTQKDKQRTFRGYSLIGAIRANKNEPNALVIPGIMDALPKLVFNTILRSIDYSN